MFAYTSFQSHTPHSPADVLLVTWEAVSQQGISPPGFCVSAWFSSMNLHWLSVAWAALTMTGCNSIYRALSAIPLQPFGP